MFNLANFAPELNASEIASVPATLKEWSATGGPKGHVAAFFMDEQQDVAHYTSKGFFGNVGPKTYARLFMMGA